jgi:hypothetical protein
MLKIAKNERGISAFDVKMTGRNRGTFIPAPV